MNEAALNAREPTTEELDARIRGAKYRQRSIFEQMTRRELEGRTSLAMFNTMLDELEAELEKLAVQRDVATNQSPK
ncbi:hypothetical protein [Aliihoeflea sp. 2WW]|uniref:hypothetical protein n=1 Tax=Aliihoeflea sp. 2WW TaxID=1381123 RepID=UPI0004675E64|nr:hypothetical protein [Aliihoeflea sp. 2WW]